MAHQFGGDAEGGAGRQHDLHHRAGMGVVVGFDQPLAVGQDGVFGVHHAVGREAALRFAQAHRPARSMQAQADFGRGLDFIIEFGTVREEIKVIGGRGAAREGQLGQGCLGGSADIFGPHPRPDGVERDQPVEQVGVLRFRDGPRQRLVKVVVGVNEPGKNDVACEVEDLIRRLGQVFRSPDRLDETVFDEQAGMSEFPALIIHGDQHFNILYQ